MLRAIRNTWRLLRMALSLARHDALFPLETLGIVPALVVWARLFARRRASGWRRRCRKWGRPSSSSARRCRPAPIF
jgi:hypothetical protein